MSRRGICRTLLLGVLALGTAAHAQIPYIDTHAHLHGLIEGKGPAMTDWDGAAQLALKTMDELGIAKTIVMPPPFTSQHRGRYAAETLKAVAQSYSGRFAFLAGGDSLSPMILDAARSRAVDEGSKRRFTEAAEKVVAMGAAGFGELTAEHFSLGPRHEYEWAPPDHPLFLVLADIAARADLPIELHLEAIEAEARLNEKYLSPPNPNPLKPNLDAFERLLAYNRKARIVWSHLGWDNTGQRTVALTRHFLARHPNLYVNIKMGGDSLPVNKPLDAERRLIPEWLVLIEEYPARFMLGSDQFYVTPRSDRRFPQHTRPVRLLLDQLPESLARKVGSENALKIYRLGR